MPVKDLTEPLLSFELIYFRNPFCHRTKNSRIDYCYQLWSPHKINEIEKLEGIARSYTCRISEATHLDYWERLSHLGLISQQRGRERYQIIYIWKILEGLSNSCPTANPIISYTNPRRGRLCFMPHMIRT